MCDRDGTVIAIEKEPTPAATEKCTGWCKIHRPLVETLKKTECRRTWLCWRRRGAVVEAEPDGQCAQGGDVRAGQDDTACTAVAAVGRRKKHDRPRWRVLVALLAACIFSICGSCIMWTTNAFDNFVANEMILDESKGSFAWWVTPPVNPWFKVYIWNYTNWDEYLQDPSIKIKLQEVGPFTFKEVIHREAIKFDEKGTTLSYREVKKYQFLPEMSHGDPNATVYVPNLTFFGATAKLAHYQIWEPIRLFMKTIRFETHVAVTAYDFIWGYEDEFFKMSKLLDRRVTMDRVGLLTKKNIPDDVVILTGRSDIDKLSYYVSYNGMTRLEPPWPDPACNVLEGSDGGMFPPRKVRAREPVYAFKAEACRLIKFVFKEKSFAQGVPAYRYHIDRSTFASPRTAPENLCYCNQTDLNECAPDGLFDTSPCSFGAPTLISYPHFYLVDEEARKPFEGLNPDAEEHDMYADIHPRLGMTLQGRSRLQLNLRVVKDLPHIKKGLVLPVAWFAQDVPSYDDDFRTMLLFATYGLDILEVQLLYVLPLTAIVIAFIIVRRLMAAPQVEAEEAVELTAASSSSTSNVSNSSCTNSSTTNSPSTNSSTTNSPSTNSTTTNSPSTNSTTTNSPSTNSSTTNSPSTNSTITNSPSTNSSNS